MCREKLKEEISCLYREKSKKDDYNIFEKLHIQNKEIIHSQFIISILKYKKDFLDSFIKLLEEIAKSQQYDYLDINFRDFDIYSEHQLKNGKEKKGIADIWIGEKSNQEKPLKRIIIENKIFAGEQVAQLDRYYDYLQTQGILQFHTAKLENGCRIV